MIDTFEARWQASLAAPRTGAIALLVVRIGDGQHDTPREVLVTRELGVEGDRWSRADQPNPEAQISLIDRRVTEVLADGDRSRLHLPGDNIVADLDLHERALPVGTRLRLGSALVEVTPTPHTGCAKFRARFGEEALAWVGAPEHTARRMRGVYLRVIADGRVGVGDHVVRE